MTWLAKTRTTKYVTDTFPDASELTIPPGSVTVEIDWWDSPVVGYSLMLRRVMTQTNTNNVIVMRTIETWNYSAPLIATEHVPVEMIREVWANTWLPGVNWRSSLMLVEKSRTTYEYATEFSDGPVRSRTVVGGYVIYDLAAENWSESTPTSDGGTAGARLDARGQRRPIGPTRIIPDTARRWQNAIVDSAIVEERDVNQLAVWVEPIEERREDVEVDALHIRRWTVRHDYLAGTTEVNGPNEEVRPGITANLPVDITPPTITATSALNQGVRIEIRGGGAIIEQWVGGLAGTPARQTRRISPTAYTVFRRIVARGPRTFTGDPYAIVSPPPPQAASWPRTDQLEVGDVLGNPVSAIGPPEPDTEPDIPDIATPDAWTQVGEIENSARTRDADGYALTFDREVEDGWTYEYYATARIGDTHSDHSNHETVTYTGPRSFTSTVGVRIIPGQTDITLDITAPADPTTNALQLGDADVGYGETMTIERLPAILDTATGDTIAIDGTPGFADENPFAWNGDLITDAVDLGRAIGLRHFMRNSDRDALQITLAAPIFGIDRGQCLSIDDPIWTTYAGGVQITSRTRTNDTKWIIEGFSIRLSGHGDGKFDIQQTITAEEVR